MEHMHMPIFCDNCSTLALAELDSSPLCEKCLFELLEKNGNDPKLLGELRPLVFRAAPEFGGIQTAEFEAA